MDKEGGTGAMNESLDNVDAMDFDLSTGGGEGGNVYIDYMLSFRNMYMEATKKIAKLEREKLELKQQFEVEKDRRENMEAEILIVKGDLNLERNQRIELEQKLMYMTETLWENRDSDSNASAAKVASSSSSSTNSFDARSLKENQDANLVMKEKQNNVDLVSSTPSDALLTLVGSLSSSSSKKARLEGSTEIANDFSNPRSNRRTATPKATVPVAPTRKSLRRLNAAAKQMVKEETKKTHSQDNPKRKRFNYGYNIDTINQSQPRKRNKERQLVKETETELTSYHGSEELIPWSSGSLY